MNYKDIPSKQYNVPKEYFEANFEAFEKSFPGYIESGKNKIRCDAWRAFEILFVKGLLSGDDTGNKKTDKRAKEGGGGDGSDSDSGGVDKVRTNFLGKAKKGKKDNEQ